MDSASRNGHLEVVQWLHTHRHEGASTDAIDYAASGGHLDVITFLHQNRNDGATVQAFE
jgi:hypothetical protein